VDERDLHRADIASKNQFAETTEVYLADMQANPNNSGGPVYRIEDGSVIGVCKARRLSAVVDQRDHAVVVDGDRELLQDAGLTVIEPARDVVNLLNEAGLGEPSDEP
jgi:hypothetical protein